MTAGSYQKAAFTDGHYEPVVMPMGLANGPAVFQERTNENHLTDSQLAQLINDFSVSEEMVTPSLDEAFTEELVQGGLLVMHRSRLRTDLSKV